MQLASSQKATSPVSPSMVNLFLYSSVLSCLLRPQIPLTIASPFNSFCAWDCFYAMWRQAGPVVDHLLPPLGCQGVNCCSGRLGCHIHFDMLHCTCPLSSGATLMVSNSFFSSNICFISDASFQLRLRLLKVSSHVLLSSSAPLISSSSLASSGLCQLRNLKAFFSSACRADTWEVMLSLPRCLIILSY
jgi:hypothetical protein